MKELYAASELAKMDLPGLPKSKAAIIARAESEGWYYEERKGIGGTRRVYEVPAAYYDAKGAQPSATTARRPIVFNEIAGQKIRRHLANTDMGDPHIVEAISLGVRNWIKNNGLQENPEKEAALVALLFSYFRDEGGVTQEKLEEMLRKVA